MSRFAARSPLIGIGRGASGPLRARLIEAAMSSLMLDFAQQEYWLRGRRFSSLSAITGWSYTRSGTAFDLAGTTSFGPNVPRRTSAGLLVEAGATNLFLNSDVGATQGITLTAVQHVLSMKGTGSITLTGTATGTLNGTGANDIVSLAFTPTAGVVTFTVSGSCTQVQVETSTIGVRSSYVPTAGVAAARGNCAASFTFTQGLPHSVIARFQTYAPAASRRVIDFATTTPLFTLSTTSLSTFDGTTTTSKTGLTDMASRTVTGASAHATGDVAVTADGATVATGTTPAAGPGGTIWLGSNSGTNNFLAGTLSLFALLPRRVSNVDLQAVTL